MVIFTLLQKLSITPYTGTNGLSGSDFKICLPSYCAALRRVSMVPCYLLFPRSSVSCHMLLVSKSHCTICTWQISTFKAADLSSAKPPLTLPESPRKWAMYLMPHTYLVMTWDTVCGFGHDRKQTCIIYIYIIYIIYAYIHIYTYITGLI